MSSRNYTKPVTVTCRACGTTGQISSRLLHKRAIARGMRCLPCARKLGIDALGRKTARYYEIQKEQRQRRKAAAA